MGEIHEREKGKWVQETCREPDLPSQVEQSEEEYEGEYEDSKMDWSLDRVKIRTLST